MAAHVPGTTLFDRRLALFIVIGLAVLWWPMLLQGGALLFPDTFSYLRRGGSAVGMLIELVASVFAAPEAGTIAGPGATDGDVIADAVKRGGDNRSLPYSAFVFLTWLPFGLIGTALIQTALVLLTLWSVIRDLVGRLGSISLAGIGAAAAAVTPMPFMASFAMPDVLGAIPVLFAMLLVRGWDGLTRPSQIALVLVTAFATVSHYGNIPLAGACIVLAVAIRLATNRRDGWTVGLAVTPVVLVLGFNAALGRLIYSEASVTPQRVPVLLARSIEDGPARWYLEENCATEAYAICELFDTFPAHVGKILWANGGIEDAPPELKRRIRAEESIILQRAVARYPFAQARSVMRNSVRQLVLVGTDNFTIGEVMQLAPHDFRLIRDQSVARDLLDAMGTAHVLSYAAGAAGLLAFLVVGRPSSGQWAMIAVLGCGVLINAAVFGGLSAPVDRYQNRVAWLVFVFAALFWAEWLARRSSAVGTAAAGR